MSLITAPMLQEPEKVAPGSIESLFVTMSPFSFDVDFSAKSCDTVILAFISPEISALEQTTSPSTTPEDPTTNFPSVFTDPFNVYGFDDCLPRQFHSFAVI